MFRIRMASSTLTYPNMFGDPCVDVTRNPLSVSALSVVQMVLSVILEAIMLYVNASHTTAMPNIITKHAQTHLLLSISFL